MINVLDAKLVPFSKSDRELAEIYVRVDREHFSFSVQYRVIGKLDLIRWPKLNKNPEFHSNLFQETCFELFIKADAKSYVEYNFSPSTDWGGFIFESYRKTFPAGPCLPMPSLEFSRLKNECILKAITNLESLALFLELNEHEVFLGPSVILFNHNLKPSYWAASHPIKKPDFHDESFYLKTK